MLEVDGVGVVATTGQGDVAKHAQRRRVLECIARHMCQKQAVALGFGQYACAQFVQQGRFAMNGALIKKHARQHQRLGVRRVDPAVKVLLPLGQWLAPGVGHGHHVARAVDVAAGIQAIADAFGQLLEVIAMLGWVEAVRQDQAVVLV